jgi:hypothetical protein
MQESLMPEREAPEVPNRRHIEHELWLAMQAAYHKYGNASAALDSIHPGSPDGTTAGNEMLEIDATVREQRTAFENYIEARMQLNEFVCSRNDTDAMSSSIRGSRAELTISRLALVSMTCAFLCATAFSLAYVARVQRQVRDLDAARHEVSATVNQTHQVVDALARKLEGLKVTQPLATGDSPSSPPPPVRPQRASARKVATRKPADQSRWRHIQTPRSMQRGTRAGLQTESNPTRAGRRLYYEFALTPSRQFKRVGPISLSVRAVKQNYKYFDLSLIVNGSRLEKKHVSLNEPVWINLGDRSRPLEVVVTRIDKNHVQGYLTESKYSKSELTASQFRLRISGGS